MDWIFILLIKGIVGFFKACILLSWNATAFLYNNHIVRKTIRQVERENNRNRGIDQINISLDSIFQNGFMGNSFISGGDKSLRSELLYSGIINSSFPSLVMHNSDMMLANQLNGRKSIVIGRNSNNFDLFFLRSDAEIINMIIESAPKSYHLDLSASDYIQGMLMFLQSKKIRPTLHRLASCPYSELIGNINAQISKGQIDAKIGRSIIMKLNAGQSERYKIEKYFHDLENECRGMNFDPKSSNCTDIESALTSGINIIIDFGGVICPLFTNLIITQIRDIKRKLSRVSIIIDDIPLNTDESIVRELIEKTTNGLIIASDDINLMFQNDESLFHTFFSSCFSKMILHQHNAISAKRLSDQVGTYKHKEVKQAIPETAFQLATAIPLGVPVHHIIDEKDEPKISTDTMQKMGKDKAFLYGYNANEWNELNIE